MQLLFQVWWRKFSLTEHAVTEFTVVAESEETSGTAKQSGVSTDWKHTKHLCVRPVRLGPRMESKTKREVWRFFRQPFRDIAALVRESAIEWRNDNAPRLSAALAFYSLLSLAPLLIVVVGGAALIFGKEAVQGQLAWEIQYMVGSQGAQAIQALLKSAYQPAAGVLATVLGVATLALGASSAFVELRDALNAIWHVAAESNTSGLASVIALVRERFQSFSLILGAGFLLLLSVLWSVWIAAIGRYFSWRLQVPEASLHVLASVVSFFLYIVLFGATYKLVPEVKLKWDDVFIGALVTSVLFSFGKQLIGIYLGKASVASSYGAAGSLVIVLVWIYYSAQVFFLGAEFTKIYARKLGSHAHATSTEAHLHPAS